MIILTWLVFLTPLLPVSLYFLDYKGQKVPIAITAVISFFAVMIMLSYLLKFHPYSWTLFILTIPLLFLIKAIIKPNKKVLEKNKNPEILDDN